MTIRLTKTISLTTESPISHYGIPALRAAGRDLGPAEQIRLSPSLRRLVAPVLDACQCGRPHATVAAGVLVAAWLGQGLARTEADDHASRGYMRQWPDGADVMSRAELICAEASGR